MGWRVKRREANRPRGGKQARQSKEKKENAKPEREAGGEIIALA